MVFTISAVNAASSSEVGDKVTETSEDMKRLFDAATKYVIVYADNEEQPYDNGSHVRHRKFTDWVERFRPEWKDRNMAGSGAFVSGLFREPSIPGAHGFDRRGHLP